MSKSDVRQEVLDQAYRSWNTVFGSEGIDPDNGVISPDDINTIIEVQLHQRGDISIYDCRILSNWALRRVLRERESRKDA